MFLCGVVVMCCVEELVDLFYVKVYVEGCMVILVVMGYVFVGDLLVKLVFFDVEMCECVVIFVEGES